MISYTLQNVAVQLYTLRDFCHTEEDLRKTAEKVRAIGYEAVQYSGCLVPPAEAKKIFDAAGLVVCATHESSDLILKNTEQACERVEQIGARHTAYPYPSGFDLSDEKSISQLVQQLDAAGAIFAKRGLTLSYHNHAQELARFGEGTALDYIYASTTPEYLKAELDTYWIKYGGGDPVAWIEKMTGRAPLMHLKDYALSKDNVASYTEVGRGLLDWSAILTAAEKAGTKWLAVEQDTCPGDPFDSVKISFDYLKDLLAK